MMCCWGMMNGILQNWERLDRVREPIDLWFCVLNKRCAHIYLKNFIWLFILDDEKVMKKDKSLSAKTSFATILIFRNVYDILGYYGVNHPLIVDLSLNPCPECVPVAQYQRVRIVWVSLRYNMTTTLSDNISKFLSCQTNFCRRYFFFRN